MTELLNDFLTGSVAWGVLLTLAAFGLGVLINRVTGKAIFNPLLLGSIFVIIFLSVCNIHYGDYKTSAAPVSYLLLPATVALAIPLYEKLDLLKENAPAIIAGISVGTLVSLGSAFALALAMDLTQEQYATLLPKSVTTAISMDVAAELGGIAALTGAIVIVTGIVGALLAETVCKLFHITDPIAKGVGIGTAAHAVGTSKALQMGDVEGAMSGLSIAVAGVLTAVPGVRGLCPLKPSANLKIQETPPATATAAGGVSLWVENKKEVKRRMVGRDQYCALFLSIRLNTGDISLFEKGEQPLLFIRCAVDGAHMVSGGFDGGAERVFVQRLLGKDHGLALGVGGRDFIHRERTAHGVIDMGFAHGTRHAAYFYGRLDHFYTFFQEYLIK